MDVVDRTASQHWRDMEQACKRVDSDTLFFGPRKHIQDLMKPRLPSDEIQALLASVQGSGNHALVADTLSRVAASQADKRRPQG
ncbi:hypothetical protein WJX79_007108 [Trebouxia sp. C0005]